MGPHDPYVPKLSGSEQRHRRAGTASKDESVVSEKVGGANGSLRPGAVPSQQHATSTTATTDVLMRSEDEQPRTDEDAAIDRASGLGRSGHVSAPTEVASVPVAMNGLQQSDIDETNGLHRFRNTPSPTEATCETGATDGLQRADIGTATAKTKPRRAGKITSAHAVILCADTKRVLVVLSTAWFIPGGLCEGDEAHGATVRRELQEESGLQIKC